MSARSRVTEAKRQAEVEYGLEHYEQAAKMLQEAVADLQDVMEAARPEERKALAGELVELCGRLGGIFKRQNELAAAAKAYDAGFQYEAAPQFEVRSSYNALNRLVVRILLRASTRPSAPALEDVDITLELRRLRSTLETSVKSDRANDFWAAGDLAVVSALLGDDSGVEAATRHFASLSPPAYAYAAYQETVSSLIDAGSDDELALSNLRHRLTLT